MKALLAERSSLRTKIKGVEDKISDYLAIQTPSTEQTAEAEKFDAEATSLRADLAKLDKRIKLAEQQEQDEVEQIAIARAAELRERQLVARKTETDTPKAGHTGATGATGAGEVGTPNIIKPRSHAPQFFTRGSLSDRQERAHRFGMFGLAMLSQDIGGAYRNRMAEEWASANLTVHQSNNSTGAHVLIPEEFATDLIDLRERFGVARRLLRQESMKSDTKVVPRRQSGLTAYFVGEGTAGTESNRKWNNVRLVAKDLMVLSRWSAQVDADAVINFGDDLAREITYAYSNKEDDCAFNGDGTSTYGGIQGIRPLVNAATAGIVTQGTGNTWAALVLTDFHNCVGKLPQYADTPNAGWVCHRTFYYGVMQKLELAAGGVTSMEISRGDRRPRPLFLGYPVDFAQVMPSTTAVATIPVLLGDLTLAAMLGDRQQEAIAFSKEASVGGESLFERNQLAIRGVERIDINVHDVGSTTEAGPVVAIKTGA